MGKRMLFCLYFLWILLFNPASVLSFEATAANISFTENYSVGESIKGNFTLAVSNIEPDALFKSSLGHSIYLRDFLKNNSKKFDCDRFNCTDRFVNSSGGITSAAASINPATGKIVGIRLDGTNVDVTDVNIWLRLNFPESNEIPLKIELAGENVWSFQNESSSFTRYENSGCLSHSSMTFDKRIGTVPYCEKIRSMPSTKKVLVGANFTGSEDKELRMELKNSRGSLIGECGFIALENRSCVMNLDSLLVSGDYFVCVSSADITNLRLGFKATNEGCGYYGSTAGQSSGDYSLFVKVPKYQGMNNLKTSVINENEKQALLRKMQDYLNRYYRQGPTNTLNCSAGCFIPLGFKGISQQLQIENISLTYSSSVGLTTENKFYNLSSVPTKANFQGTVELGSADFRLNLSGTSNISFSVERGENIKLFERTVRVRGIPIAINTLSPTRVSAGIPSLFIANVSSTYPIVSYKWFFGDGISKNTGNNTVKYLYSNISQYNLTLEVVDNQSNNATRIFAIESISPKERLNSTINEKREKVSRLVREIDNLTVPFKDKLKQRLNIESIQTTLNQIESERKTATTDEEFLELAIRLNSVVLPRSVWVEERLTGPFITDFNLIDLDEIEAIAGGQQIGEKAREYISDWERRNVNGNKEEIKVVMTNEEGVKKILAWICRVRATADGERAYLVFQKSPSLESSIGLQQFGNSKVLELTPGEEKILDVISFGNVSPIIYVTPDPKSIEIVGALSSCNSNGVCDSDSGEDYDNCRSDCKPWLYAWLMFAGVLVATIILYTIMQIEFKKRYELKLFGSRQELLNIVEAVKNSQENGIPEKELVDKLIKNGWSKEQVIYAVKKSKGERTRPYELVPVEKLMARLEKSEDKEAKK